MLLIHFLQESIQEVLFSYQVGRKIALKAEGLLKRILAPQTTLVKFQDLKSHSLTFGPGRP